MEKNTKIIIGVLAVIIIALVGYIIYINTQTETVTEEETSDTTITKEKTEKIISDSDALVLGKELYVKVRDNAYNYLNYELNTSQMKYFSGAEIGYYEVTDTSFKNYFTDDGYNQFITFMNDFNAGKVVIQNDKFYVRDGLSNDSGLDKTSTSITINEKTNDKISYDVQEKFCQNNECNEIATTFTIKKQGDNYLMDNYIDPEYKLYEVTMNS